MNKILEWFKSNKDKKPVNTYANRGGTYSLGLSALVLAILIVANILVSKLPSTWTKIDISSSRLYSITSNTKVVVNHLDKEVTIYWIVQAGEEDTILENLLAKYDSLSSNITVVKKNPDIYPTFAAQYTDETVSNNSIIVECGSKSRYISYDTEIYLTDVDYNTYTSSYSFDGEGAITSAIDYVVSDDLPKVYIIEGHGEQAISSSLSDQIKKENIETEGLSLLKVDEIPDDADALIIHAPTSDISLEEAEMLIEYVEDGGKLLVVSGLETDDLPNLDSILNNYGVEKVDGIVIEGDRNHYAFQMPYLLIADMESSTITDSLINEGYNVILPIAQGLDTSVSINSTITPLLSTSSAAYSKVDGYSISTYDEEDNDIDGPFDLAISLETTDGGTIIWISSSYIFDDSYNSYSSGANNNFGMNCLSSLIGEREALAIRSKSLNYTYLTISDSVATALKRVMIGAIPASVLLFGVLVIIRRKKGNHE